ncbi:GGDEF domain-containing protein [Stutzerimonas kirkiae]|uniref:GGDEF domain-containing protein n=1 Tax=Stutzerimonas kirkiae TaxID=2211392 RepID=UPI0010384A64|nr:GGDEF domain-containing protein [Stutzerimonas kirkiae]TBV04464.1 GGDEF domain-containing protein [Stutzerimonas kirkiae]TBV11897.1 GGDEF domain-containing protein [Stutzerimonas kirkiae]
MSEEAQRWKGKYLRHVEQQEVLEARWEARLDLLRRSLVRSSLAVEGADPAVEQCMREMRELLRDGDLDEGLSALVPRLEKAVLDSERHRQARIASLIESLEKLANQLLAQPVPANVRKPLKQFVRRLDRYSVQSRTLPALLTELSLLQGQALQQADEVPPRGNFIQRLFGLGGSEPPLLDQPLPTVEDAGAEAVRQDGRKSEPDLPEAPADPLSGPEEDAPPTPAPALSSDADADADADAEPAADAGDYLLPVMPDQAYSVIAGHVESTLVGLLDELPLPDYHQAQAQVLRERIQKGLNWYELAPVLDDLAVLAIAVSDQGKREFENYLQLLNERLLSMQDSLGAARQGHEHNQSAAQALDQELRQHVGDLHDHMRQAADLPSLKEIVVARLDGLLETVDSYQLQRRENERRMSERLQMLVGRIANLEEATEGLRGHLEEQRLKALRDSLTALPNRAAWSERLELEVGRWQRYGRPLQLAVLDVDYFKRVNDNYGHLAGDRVLKIIASELQKRLRKTDFIARFGGEEFALLLPETTTGDAANLLDTLRKGISACPFHFKGERVQITLSAGFSDFQEGDTPDKVFERADGALYRAKEIGRDRVEQG